MTDASAWDSLNQKNRTSCNTCCHYRTRSNREGPSRTMTRIVIVSRGHALLGWGSERHGAGAVGHVKAFDPMTGQEGWSWRSDQPQPCHQRVTQPYQRWLGVA